MIEIIKVVTPILTAIVGLFTKKYFFISFYEKS